MADMAVAAWWPVHEEWSYFDKTMRSDMTAWHLRLYLSFRKCVMFTQPPIPKEEEKQPSRAAIFASYR